MNFGGEGIKIRWGESTGAILLGGGRMSKFSTGVGDSLHPASIENPNDLGLFCREKNHFRPPRFGSSHQSEKKSGWKDISFGCFDERTKIFVIQTSIFVKLITVKIKK